MTTKAIKNTNQTISVTTILIKLFFSFGRIVTWITSMSSYEVDTIWFKMKTTMFANDFFNSANTNLTFIIVVHTAINKSKQI
jgi:hypothetical protein